MIIPEDVLFGRFTSHDAIEKVNSPYLKESELYYNLLRTTRSDCFLYRTFKILDSYTDDCLEGTITIPNSCNVDLESSLSFVSVERVKQLIPTLNTLSKNLIIFTVEVRPAIFPSEESVKVLSIDFYNPSDITLWENII
ncbi:hypothetical protein CL653_03410 [bacterium]|nr:hypothetical protein [bacterium]|tara:strand:- start:155 stop:571 length:417 start_codon:yes stop_codon:yes gene_type:complete